MASRRLKYTLDMSITIVSMAALGLLVRMQQSPSSQAEKEGMLAYMSDAVHDAMHDVVADVEM